MKEAEVGRFLRLLTHDLQNQLGAFDLSLQVIPSLVPATDPTMITIEPFLTRATLAATDMNEALVDVQTFARLVSATDEAGGVPPAPEITNLNLSRKISDIGYMLAGAAKERKIDLQIASGENVIAKGSSQDVLRSIRILVMEGLRGSFPDSIVKVSATASPIPVIEISTTQEGLFEEKRPTLAIFLAKNLLAQSKVTLQFAQTSPISILRLVW